MSFGLQLMNASGTVVFDTTAKGASLFHDSFSVAGNNGSPYTVSYTALTGRTVRWTLVPESGTPALSSVDTPLKCAELSVSYSSGHPVVTVTPRDRDTRVYVFIAT